MHKSKKIKLSKNNNANYSKKFGYYIPIILIIVLIPLITYGKIVELSIEEANFWRGGTTHVDFFNYYKSITLIIVTLCALGAYGGLFLNNKLPIQKEAKYYIPISIYIIMAILSTVFSRNINVALFGFIEMYQGVFVLICYMILTFILINYTRDERDIKVIIFSMVALVLIEGLLGIGQYFGYDFFKTALGQWLISPKILKGTEIKFTFGKYAIYGTMYNTNFVGSFGALVLPITIALFLAYKDWKKSIIFGLVSLIAFATWLGSNSRAGYLGISIASIIALIIFRNIIKKEYKKLIFLFSGFIFVTLLFNIVSDGRVLNQFSRLNPVNEVKRIEDAKEYASVKFEEVSVKENSFKIKTNSETLIGILDNSSLNFKDELGNKLGVLIDKEGNIRFIDSKYDGYIFNISQNSFSIIKANVYGRNWDLFVTEDQYIKVLSFNNKLTEPIEAQRLSLLDGKETFASNRGYIWSRTIPMLKDTMLIGYGPDNYPMAFPQEDYVGRFNTGSGLTDIVVDKPHNMYLQTAVNTGVISLFMLIAIWGIYIIDSFNIYKDGNIESFVEYIGAATFISINAYLIAGIFNDSVVSIAPLFWMIFGMGIGINRIVNLRS